GPELDHGAGGQPPGMDPAPDPLAGLQDQGLQPAVGQGGGRGQPGEAGPDHAPPGRARRVGVGRRHDHRLRRSVWPMPDEEARIALFIDHENLVIGAREIGRGFDVGPIFDALAERGRVVARRAYADWTLFAGDRRTLVEHNCELIDIPQRTGAARKNAADIKLAVDAMELAYERGFVSTFVIASGDSDFTPLVAALRGLNRRVIGIGVKGSPSSLLPPACDEFLFYDRLPGVEVVQQGGRRAGNGAASQVRRPPRRTSKPRTDDGAPPAGEQDLQELQRQLTQTPAGLKQSGAEPVLASSLKRALLRKDPTFSESDY